MLSSNVFQFRVVEFKNSLLGLILIEADLEKLIDNLHWDESITNHYVENLSNVECTVKSCIFYSTDPLHLILLFIQFLVC